MNKLIAITTTVLLLICFSTATALAGSARKHTIEGIMIGTGVAILGAAIINEINRDAKPQYRANYARHDGHRYAGYRYDHKRRNHRRYKSHRSRGHWEIERVWIDPVYEKKWNPGHYNRRGKWISGRVEKFMIKDGYWQEEKLWVWY